MKKEKKLLKVFVALFTEALGKLVLLLINGPENDQS